MTTINNPQSADTVHDYLDRHWDEDCSKSVSNLAEIFYPLGHETGIPAAEKCLSAKSLLRLKGNHSG